MLLLALLFVGVLGTIITLGTLAGSALIDTVGGTGSHLIDAVGGFVGVFVWIGFALGARNVEAVSNGTIVAAGANPTLFAVGVIMAVVSLLVGLLGAGFLVDIRRDTDATRV